MTAAPAPQRPSPSGKPPAGDLRTAEAEVEEAAQRWRLREVGLRERYERRLLLRRGLVEEPRRINGLGVLLDSKHGVSGLLTISSVEKNGSFFFFKSPIFHIIDPCSCSIFRVLEQTWGPLQMNAVRRVQGLCALVIAHGTGPLGTGDWG